MGVWHASASASFSVTNARKQAAEQTHTRMREQSSKLSNEIKQNYKTTFRTVTETTDTSSRRYLLQNTTQKLVSYELSRKMRKVGVQVQVSPLPGNKKSKSLMEFDIGFGHCRQVCSRTPLTSTGSRETSLLAGLCRQPGGSPWGR